MQMLSVWSGPKFCRLVKSTQTSIITLYCILCMIQFAPRFRFNSLTIGRKRAPNLFPNKPLFLDACSTSPVKLWRKKKLLITRISPFPLVFSTPLENFPTFSHNDFFPFCYKPHNLHNTYFLLCNYFNLN